MTPIDPNTFDTWTAVAALFILVAGAVAMKWLSTVKSESSANAEKLDTVVSTLTTNNSGSHIKDQLDRFEGVQKAQNAAMTEIARKLDQHLADSPAAYSKAKEDLITYAEERYGLKPKRVRKP